MASSTFTSKDLPVLQSGVYQRSTRTSDRPLEPSTLLSRFSPYVANICSCLAPITPVRVAHGEVPVIHMYTQTHIDTAVHQKGFNLQEQLRAAKLHIPGLDGTWLFILRSIINYDIVVDYKHARSFLVAMEFGLCIAAPLFRAGVHSLAPRIVFLGIALQIICFSVHPYHLSDTNCRDEA